LSASLLAFLTLAPLPRAAHAEVPTDGWIVWQSIRQDSRFEVYRARADGSEVTRLTTTGAGAPLWSPDGRWVAYRDEVGGVYLMHPDGSAQHAFSNTARPVFWLHDNAGLVINDGTQYLLLDPESEQTTPMFATSDFPQFAGTTFLPNAMTHDNRYLLLGSHLYDNGYTGANGSFKSGFSAVMVDLFHKDKTYFIGNGCWPFSPPEGDLVFHICNDCPQHPDIYRMHVADLATRSSYLPEESHLDADWGHEYNPRVSNDNKWLVYMTSTGCHEGVACDYEIFLHRLGAGPTERTRVTTSPTFDGYPDMHVGPLWKPETTPQLVLRPDRLTFFASATALPAAQTIKIKNGGGGALGAVKAAIEPAVPWLSLASDAASITLQVKGDGLTVGQNQAVVSVSAGGVPGAISIPIVVNADDSFPRPEAGAVETDASGDAAAAVADAGAGDAATTTSSGCSCAVTTANRGGAGALVSLALAVGLGLRTRARRRRG
jgi:hypothetical protein